MSAAESQREAPRDLVALAGQNTEKAVSDLFDRVRAAQSALAEREEQLRTRHEQLRERQAKLTRENGGEGCRPDDKVQLNVGGKSITALRSTLTQLEGTRLEALFSGRWESELLRDRQNRVFLDLEPTCFLSLLEYLRNLKIAGGGEELELPQVSDPELDAHFEVFLDLMGLRETREEPEDLFDDSKLSKISVVDRPDSPEGENKVIEELQSDRELSVMREGEPWFVVHHRWWKQWTDFTEFGYDSSFSREMPAPGKIRNGALLDPNVEGQAPRVKKTLMEYYDYVLVNRAVWANLHHWYGGGPAIPRRVIESGYPKVLTVEIRPAMVRVFKSSEPEKFKSFLVSKADTVLRTKRRFCKDFGLKIDDIQLWDFHGGRKYKHLNKDDAKIDGCQILDNQALMLQEKDDKGAFPMVRSISSAPRRIMPQSAAATETQGDDGAWAGPSFKNVPAEVVPVLEEQLVRLKDYDAHLSRLEANFETERAFVESFTRGKNTGVVDLDVSGEKITVLRSTLMLCPDSMLARKFDDKVWAQDEADDESVWIDQDPYCFGKIISQLRLHAMVAQMEGDGVPPPFIVERQRSSFNRLLSYYFPGVEKFIDPRAEVDNAQQERKRAAPGNAEGEQDAKRANLGAEGPITLKVISQDRRGTEVFFKIHRNTPLRKLMDAYCDRLGKDPRSMRFLCGSGRSGGWSISGPETPNSLGMEDGDVIDALKERSLPSPHAAEVSER